MAAKIKFKTCWWIDKLGPDEVNGWPEHLNGVNYERNSNP